MAEVSGRTYVHIGSLVFGVLGLILPIVTFSGFISALGLESMNMFDAVTTIGIFIYFGGLVLAFLATTNSHSGGKSKTLGIIGGLLFLVIYGINSAQIEDVSFYGGSPGIGHYCVLIASILSIAGGFVTFNEEKSTERAIKATMASSNYKY